ncbi:hypothetical protein P692DRAFT_20138470, partial [Suillus brevipes Sb2]
PVTLALQVVFLVPASRYPHSLRTDHPPHDFTSVARSGVWVETQVEIGVKAGTSFRSVHHPVPNIAFINADQCQHPDPKPNPNVCAESV